MKPIRFSQWRQAPFPPGPRRDQCRCLLLLRPSPHSSHFYVASRLFSSTSPSETDAQAPLKPKRGRPKIIKPSSPPSTRLAPRPSSPRDSATQTPSISSKKSKKRVSASRDASDGLVKGVDVAKLTFELEQLPSPPIHTPSPKLAALHARLSLSPRIPIQTLARCLVDQTADPDYRFNNNLLARLGGELLAYYVSEHFICRYPRLPMTVLVAAIDSHLGFAAMRDIAKGWGVEEAAEPGGEVDPGLLQFRRELPTKIAKRDVVDVLKEFNKTQAGRAMEKYKQKGKFGGRLLDHPLTVTLEQASTNFVRAVFGAMYLHSGLTGCTDFIKAHVLSRHLELDKLFAFRHPTRDLVRLCSREGFEPPIARLISETGRESRHPVFVVGIFSGRDKIGEDAGASLDEGRFKAAAKALKGWYLYSPIPEAGEITLPSEMVGEAGKNKDWQPIHIDDGEVIV